jgi:hypothetical protein
MATATDWARLRQLINEPDDTNGWTDVRLDAVLVETANPDGSLDFRAAASAAWSEVAASYVSLVNISENGSSRSSSQQFDHATKMATLFATSTSDDTGDNSLRRPRSNRIVRPTRNG